MSLCLQMIRDDNYTLSLYRIYMRHILKLWLTESCNTPIRATFHVDLVNWSQVKCFCVSFGRVARWQCTRGSISSLALEFGCISFMFFRPCEVSSVVHISNQRVACSSVWWKWERARWGALWHSLKQRYGEGANVSITGGIQTQRRNQHYCASH